jgi:hypothetical protein
MEDPETLRKYILEESEKSILSRELPTQLTIPISGQRV